MLSAEDNELITHVGPGTPMGDLMRQYWLPAMLSSELPQPDGDPVRVMLLGEKLIAFRDSAGRVGLLQNHCPHRGASLFFARNEEGGLRCPYHGWKFDACGQCVDMPNELPESRFKEKIAAVAYPCVERGGVVWAYLGPRGTPPPLPDLEGNTFEGEQASGAGAIMRECNYLQALEGDLDTSHVGWLHWGTLKVEDQSPDKFMYYTLKDKAPRYKVVDVDAGATYGAYRPGPPGFTYWRIANYLFPVFTMTPTNVLGLKTSARAWVPMDDQHTLFFYMQSRGRGPAGADSSSPEPQAVSLAVGPGGVWGSEVMPNSTDWFGRFRMFVNGANDYDVDRAKQRNMEEYSGVAGIHMQDQMVTESMGQIYDRRQEHLGTSDLMVIRTRQRLLQAARALDRDGVTPPGVDNPEAYRLRAGGVYLPEGADWIEATRELRTAFVEHPELDPTLSGGA